MDSGIEAHYRTCFPAIREKCRRMLRDPDEAQDVAQVTLVRFWRSGPKGADARQATAWIYTTCTRLAIDRLRRRHRTRDLASPEGADCAAGAGAETALLGREELERISEQVPTRELEAAVLHRIDGLSQPEIAELTCTSERTVRRLLERFDARLQSLRSKGALS
jgi:RNA polymerase sigma-70 factor (ECF subfamily)